MNLFGKKKAAPAPKLADSIHQLREAQTMLDKREKHLEKQMQQCKSQAREKLLAKDKRGAMFLIKRSKMFENQINQIYGKKGNIDVQIMALEAASSNKEIFSVMKLGKDALKAATAATNVDQVADVMEDINESIQMADEVNEALSQQIGPQLDEDELTKELEEMESELVDQQVLAAPAIPVTAVKSTPISTPTTITAPAVKEKEVVLAGGSSSSSSAAVGKVKANLNEKESRELKELEELMGV